MVNPGKANFHPVCVDPRQSHREIDPKLAAQPVLRDDGLKVRCQFKAQERLAL